MKADTILRFIVTLLVASLLTGCGGGSSGGTSAPQSNSLAQIQTTMKNFAGCLLQSCATASNYLAPAFLMDGMNAGSYIGSFSNTTPIANGDYFLLTLASVFDSINQNNNAADVQWVNLTQFNSAGTILGQSRVKFVNSGSNWLLAGNEREVLVNLRAESGMVAAASATPATFSSDINLAIDPLSASNAGIAAAWLSGSNIVTAAASGVLAYSNPAPTLPASAVQANLILPVCSASITGNCTNPVDGSTYTITLFDIAGKKIATYQEVLTKAPLQPAALTAAEFPTITSTLLTNSSGNLITLDQATQQTKTTVTWSIPLDSNGKTKLAANWIEFSLWDTNGMMVCQLAGIPAGNSFSADFQKCTLPDPANSGIALARSQVTLQAADAYGRQYILFE
jgi:hypothetical protein